MWKQAMPGRRADDRPEGRCQDKRGLTVKDKRKL